jgi:hypothetical protein
VFTTNDICPIPIDCAAPNQYDFGAARCAGVQFFQISACGFAKALEISQKTLAARPVRGFHTQTAHLCTSGAGVFVSPEHIVEHGSITCRVYTFVFHEPLNNLVAAAQ